MCLEDALAILVTQDRLQCLQVVHSTLAPVQQSPAQHTLAEPMCLQDALAILVTQDRLQRVARVHTIRVIVPRTPAPVAMELGPQELPAVLMVRRSAQVATLATISVAAAVSPPPPQRLLQATRTSISSQTAPMSRWMKTGP
jgi:hypothetical protein